MPYYWSGTNCRGYGNLYVYPPITGVPIAPQFDSAALFVGGYLVRTWERNTNDIPIQHVFLGVMFDASHFDALSSIEVKITGYDNLGRYYEGVGTAQNLNRARCYQFWDFPQAPGGDGASIAYTRFSAMKYASSYHNGGWSDSYFVGLLWGSVLYVNTHGSPGSHSGGYPSAGSIKALPTEGAFDYLSFRTEHNGNGLPPYNSTELPSINLSLNECCNCGDDDQFLSTLLPFANYYIDYWENQAVHAYSVFTLVGSGEAMADVQTKVLASGGSVLQMKVEMALSAVDEQIYCSDERDGDVRPMNQLSDQVILGDHYARAKNVYIPGYGGTSEAWYRTIADPIGW